MYGLRYLLYLLQPVISPDPGPCGGVNRKSSRLPPNFNCFCGQNLIETLENYIHPRNFDFTPPNLKTITESLIIMYYEPVRSMSPTEFAIEPRAKKTCVTFLTLS